jgi:23S rRNA (cytosine1962-C5)-methyltransferase
MSEQKKQKRPWKHNVFVTDFNMNRIRLKEGKQKKIINNYPWIFKDDVATYSRDCENIEDGTAVEVSDSQDNFLGTGFYNSQSHILIRIVSKQNVKLNKDFFHHRIKKILEFRHSLQIPSNAIRLIHSEADFIPGLIVDRYDHYLAVQFRTLGMDRLKNDIIDILNDLIKPHGIYERSDMESRLEEGLPQSSGILAGMVPQDISIYENDLNFQVDIAQGHKTGFYLDQRDNRFLVKQWIKPQQKGLDLFCYTGGFAIAMAKSGGMVTGIDSDIKTIDSAKTNAKLNTVTANCTFECHDVFEYLEKHPALPEASRYNMIILDPPAIAKRKEGIQKLKWSYWKLLFHSIPLLRRGGTIILSSCAYHMSTDLMLEAARFASADHGVRLRVAQITYQPPDHPWILQIPETLYLKSVFLQMI